MSESLLAIAVTAVGLSISALWFGVSRRRKAETEIGIQSLANMKWRECVAVVLESLQREGYRPNSDSMATGDGGTEFLLDHGNDKVLFCYKHGTAYHLSGANVREFANALRMRGAGSGILLTLGSVEGPAELVAKSSNVELIDGAALWPKVRQLIPPEMFELVKRQAAARTRNSLWAGVLGSALAGAAIYLLVNLEPDSGAPVATSVPAPKAGTRMAGSRVQAPRSDAAMLKQIDATAKAMAEVAKLPSSELTRRRAEVVKKVSSIAQVERVAWSAQRTLVVTLNNTDGKDKGLIEETCRILTQFEEMRFTRLQLEPPADSGLAVRWRLCD